MTLYLKPAKFLASDIPRIGRTLNRAATSIQVQKKVCAQCGQGFSKRLGRPKWAKVGNMPGRHVCKPCCEAIMRESDAA